VSLGCQGQAIKTATQPEALLAHAHQEYAAPVRANVTTARTIMMTA
jgi:hypothetical protein